MRISATFIDGDRTCVDRVIDWSGNPGDEFKLVRPPVFTTSEEPHDPEKALVGVELYRHVGEMPNHTHIFIRQKDGLMGFVNEQFFRGPDQNTLNGWMRVLGEADRELHMSMIRASGVNTWPGKPGVPPYLKLHDEVRFVTDACESQTKPYLYMYHRCTWGVSLRRIM